MTKQEYKYDVVVIGAGPGGLAAAHSAAQNCASVGLFESSPWLGGQIWRYGNTKKMPAKARKWVKMSQDLNITVHTETTIVATVGVNTLLAENASGPVLITFKKCILAVGARELFVPFPGWTLPNVFGTGALHNLAKFGWSVRGKRIAVAGSGPLMFSVAAHLRLLGAKILILAEQADLSGLIKFGMQLPFLAPDKMVQAGYCQSILLGVPYKTHCWPVKAVGQDQLEAVQFSNEKKTWTVPCDYLACAFGLTGNLELPSLLGCRIEGESVVTNIFQETSVKNIYCVGEPTGVAGVDGALVEGQIAGFAATGQEQQADKYLAKKRTTQKFGRSLERSFALRKELRSLATPDTILCRCEDVTVGDVLNEPSGLAAKLYHHIGMGPCQGRTCGGAVRFLLGWQHASIRPPVYPVKAETLTACHKTGD